MLVKRRQSQPVHANGLAEDYALLDQPWPSTERRPKTPNVRKTSAWWQSSPRPASSASPAHDRDMLDARLSHSALDVQQPRTKLGRLDRFLHLRHHLRHGAVATQQERNKKSEKQVLKSNSPFTYSHGNSITEPTRRSIGGRMPSGLRDGVDGVVTRALRGA